MLDKVFKFIERFVPTKYKWVLNHDGFKRYFANTGWMFGGQMFSLVVSFFIGAWLARYLGPENYGVLSYALAFVGLFGFIAPLGVDAILSRELVKFPERRDGLLGTAFCIKLIGGFIAFLLVVLSTIFFLTEPLVKLLVILFSLSFILQSINVISSYFQSEVKSENNIKTLLFATTISSILKIAAILLGKGVIWIILVFVLDYLLQGIGFMRAYKHYGLKINDWHFSLSLAKEMLNYSWPLILANASLVIYLRIDQVMIGSMLSIREVGLYAVSVKLVEVWNFIPNIICASLFPAIINAKKSNHLIYKKRLKALSLLLVGVALCIAFFSTFFAPWIIGLLFGKDYLAAVAVLQIYVWSSIGFSLSFVITQYFLSENRSSDVFVYNLFSMLVNVILNIILIPRMGLIGAAWATLISYSFGPIVVIILGPLKSFRAKST